MVIIKEKTDIVETEEENTYEPTILFGISAFLDTYITDICGNKSRKILYKIQEKKDISKEEIVIIIAFLNFDNSCLKYAIENDIHPVTLCTNRPNSNNVVRWMECIKRNNKWIEELKRLIN